MLEASNQVTIARRPSDVFAFLANAENDPKWRQGVLQMEKISGDGVGARYRQVVSGPGGRRVDADIEITDFAPDRRIGFKALAGPVRPVGAYELSPSGNGTAVTLTLRAELRGLKKLMTPMVRKTMDGEVMALENLRRVLETA